MRLGLALFSFVLLAFISPAFAACSSDSQCPEGMRCDMSMGSWGVCEPKPAGGLRECKEDADCSPGTVCVILKEGLRCVDTECAMGEIACPRTCSNGAIYAAGTCWKGYCEAGAKIDECPSGKCADAATCAPEAGGCSSNEDCKPVCKDGLMHNANCIDGVCTATRPLMPGGKGVPCEGGPKEDKCAAVECTEQFCRGDTRYYNGKCSSETGECVYNSAECQLGCNENTGLCIQEEKIELSGLTLEAGKQSLVLNGRDAVKVSGRAYGKDSGGNQVPYKGELRFEGSGEGGRDIIFGPSSVKVSVDPSVAVKDGKFSFFVSSYEKISQKVDLKGAKLVVSSSEMPNVKIEIALKSPAPVIKKFRLKNRPSLWQDSYGVFEAEVEDPDNNIKVYDVKSEHGELRLYGVEWGEEKQVSHPSNAPNFEFGWKAPKLTQEMKLDYTKKIYERVKGAVSKIAEKALDDKLKGYAASQYKKTGRRWTPDVDEMKALVEAAGEGKALDAADVVAKYVVTRHKLSRKAYKETTEPLNAIYERGEALVELYKVGEEAEAQTAEQGQELGEAYEEDASFFEYAARVGIIGVQGYRMYDGVMSTGGKLAGEEGDESFMGTVKDAAKEMTIGVAEDSLKFVADNYKAARAKMISLPFIIKLQVTDEDGYTATKGVLVEVEGYERVIAG